MVKLRAKCILVGDASVGKSALAQMFRSDGAHFPKNYSMTAGVELLVKSITIPGSSDSVELFIFDSGGKETFQEACEKLKTRWRVWRDPVYVLVCKEVVCERVHEEVVCSAAQLRQKEASYIEWAQPSVLCLVFDVSSAASFRSCGQWLERVRGHCQGLQVPGVLVGNKSDLSSRREVDRVEALDWAQSQGLEYHETSAKEMENCEAPFLSLAQAFYAHYQDRVQTIQTLG